MLSWTEVTFKYLTKLPPLIRCVCRAQRSIEQSRCIVYEAYFDRTFQLIRGKVIMIQKHAGHATGIKSWIHVTFENEGNE